MRYDMIDHVVHITMNRPEKLNAINARMRSELFKAFERFRDDSGAWVAVFGGTGRAFSTGHDLTEPSINGQSPGRGSSSLDELYFFLSELSKPVIGAINGYCLAQGAGLALLTDIRIATPTAAFGWPQAKLGLTSISGPAIATQYFPRAVALEALITGEPISAEVALRFGVISQIVPPEALRSTATELAVRICRNGPLAVRGMKEAALRGVSSDLRDRIAYAGLISDRAANSRDQTEALRAFAEGRPPSFTGE